MPQQRDSSNEPIAIIGIGSIFPGSTTTAGFFRNILRKRCFIADLPEWAMPRDLYLSADPDEPLKSYSGIGALLGKRPPDVTEFRIPPVAAKQMDRTQKLALICARDALADAGYLDGQFDRDRVGVFVANSRGGRKSYRTAATFERMRDRARLRALAEEQGTEAQLDAILSAYYALYPSDEVNADTLPGEAASIIAGRISSHFDLHGPHLCVESACASSLAAVWNAALALHSGACDMVIAGGVETKLGPGDLVTFAKMTALSAVGCFPFDTRADGTVLGEGCAMTVLKRYADALRDGDRIYALVLGCGASSDGAGKGITAPSADGQRIALRRAYEDAGLDPMRLDYVECHGTATAIGDQAELDSVSSLADVRSEPLPIGSVKAMIGHGKAVAGAAGLLKGVLAINGRVVPPQVNFEQAVPELGDGLRVPNRVEPLEQEDIHVGVSAFGVGGTNFHVVLGSPPENRREPLVRGDDFRLAELPPLENDIAFLFPGQGSQHLGMLRGFHGDPTAEDMIARADRIFEEITGRVLSEVIDPESSDEAGLRDTAISQAAIFLVSAIQLQKLRDLGVDCGMAIGHSLGEYAALHAAGALTFEDTLTAVTHRGLIMADQAAEDAGAMAFVAADSETVTELIASVDGYAAIANFNTYEQVVVSGETAAVDAVVKRASAQRIPARRLNVSAGFHSRMVSNGVPAMKIRLEELNWSPLRIPVPANVAREVHPIASKTAADRERVIDLLLRQIGNPVDFVAQIELAYESGVRRFVEVGPKKALSGLVANILRGKPFQALSADSPDVLQQLAEPVCIERLPLPAPGHAAKKTVQSTVDASLSARDQIRQVVAAVSGYELSEIGDDAEFESDLGIDTLKIFEIFFRLQGHLLSPGSGNFRDLTSVNKLVAAAEQSTDKSEQSDAEIGCYRYVTERAGSIEHYPSISPSRRYRVLTGDSQNPGVLHDALSDDTLVLMPLTQTGEELCAQTIPNLTRTLRECAAAAAGKQRKPRFHLVTFGETASSHRALCGFVKSVQLDIPELRISYDHLDHAQPDDELLRRILAADPHVGRRVLADGTITHGRLVRSEPKQNAADLAQLLGPDDRILVTGGAGGIGSSFVRHLLPQVESRFLLVGRRPQVDAWIQDEERVDYISVDVSDADAMRAVDWGRVTLVVHAAGVVESSNIKVKPFEKMARVLSTKVLGLENLMDSLDPASLRGLVCFSSISAFLGDYGLGDYAAANGYFDGFERGALPVLSIGWGPWADIGMAATEWTEALLKSEGWHYIPVDVGIDRFERLLSDFLANPGPVTDHDYAVFSLAGSLAERQDPLLRDLDV